MTKKRERSANPLKDVHMKHLTPGPGYTHFFVWGLARTFGVLDAHVMNEIQERREEILATSPKKHATSTNTLRV